MLFETIEAH